MNEEKRQRKRSTLFSLMFIIAVVVITTSILFTILLVHYRTEDLIAQADLKLLTAAELSREILGPDYHDRIVDERSISKERFSQIVARNDDLCRRLKLQYLWSVLLVDKSLVFTSATHSNLTDSHSPCASFFEKHRDPESFASALPPEGKTSFSSFHNEWGQGRQVLIPGKDARGRTYIFGASIQLTELDAMVRWTILTSLGIGMTVIVAAFLLAMALARSFTAPIEQLTKAAERMASGHLDVPLVPAGTRELNSLAISLDHMRQGLQQHIEALRKNEELLKKAQEIAHIGSWELDPSTNLLIWSDEVFRIFGLQPQEINATYESFLSSIHPDDRTIVDKAYRDSLIEGRDSYQIEHRIIRTNTGEVRVVREKCEHLRDVSGKIIRSLGMVQDITAEKRDEEALRRSHQTFLMVLDGIDATIYVADMETYEILFMNKCMIDAFGADLTGRICHEVFRRESSPCGHCTNDQLMDADGNPTSACAWETKNPITGKWYINYDRSILWVDSRMVRLQIATDITERKLAEMSIRESEEKFSKAFEKAPLLMTISSIDDGTYLDVNEKFIEVSGFEREEVIGKTSVELGWLNPKDRDLLIHDLKENGSVDGVELELIAKDKRNVFCLYYGEVINIGGQQRLLSIAQDITERRHTEDDLRVSEERFRLLSEAAFEAIAIHEEGVLINANDQYFTMFGYEPGDALGKQMMSMTIAPEAIEFATKQIATDSLGPYESIGIRKDGTRFPMEVRARKMDYKGRNVRFAAIVDISARKQAEDALRESEELFRVSMEKAPDGVYMNDLEGNFLYGNRKAEEIIDYRREELIGRNFLDLNMIAEGSIGKAAELMKANIEGKSTGPDDLEMIRKDGRRILIEITTNVVQRGGQTNVLAFVRDITERRQIEKETQLIEERLQRAEKMESLGLLAGGVAHDLNNVLGIVVGYSEMLVDELDKSNPMREDLKKILEGGNRSAAIVQDLLTLARRGVQNKRTVNMNALIKDCQNTPEFEKVFAYNQHVKLKMDLESDLLNIMGSSVHLGKTLINLVSNAVEAMHDGGVLKISTTNQYLDMPIHGYDNVREGDYVVLTVSDTGEGILERDIKRIFEPFYTKKIMGRSGTGLGLAVVWGTIKDHNGYINVASSEGKGTTFTLYFPVTREEMESEQISLSMSEYMGNGETILIVDDVDRQRELAFRMLTKLNYSVSMIASGEEAIEYLKTNKTDLIVLDMIMEPGIDGLETYENILKLNPVQKAVIVSGFSESDRVKEAQRIGAGAYVPKPYVLERLGMAVRKELDRK